MVFCIVKVHLENFREEDFQMKKSVQEFIAAIEEIGKAVEEDLGKEAICGPAVKAFELALQHNPWIAWELAVQFHLDGEKYEHAMYALYDAGELGVMKEEDLDMLLSHCLNVRNREEKIGCVCAECYKRIKYNKHEHSLYCSIDCTFKGEVGDITVPDELAPIEPIWLIVSPVHY